MSVLDRHWRAATLALVAMLAAACTGGGGAPEQQDATAALTYGYGPQAHPDIEYQPDVVLVAGGPSAIRSATADGLTWTLAPDAPGVDRLAPGKIMFATARAVGRIARMEEAADGVRVTLAPVSLTDILRTAHVNVDQAITAGDLVMQEVPEMAGRLVVDDPPPLTTPLRFANIAMAAGDLPPAQKNSIKVTVGNGEFEPYVSDDRLGIKAALTAVKGKDKDDSASLKGGFEFALKYDKGKLRLVTAFDIVNGKAKSLTVLLEGITGMAVDIASSIGQGQNDTRRYRVELPIELNFPIPAYGFLPPLVLQLKWKFISQIALSAKNTVLSSRAEYALVGPIGVRGGSAIVPKLSTTETGLIKETKGVSVGISALVVGWELRAMLGVGVPAFMAGPYAKIAVSLSLLRASDVTSLFGVCTQGSLKVTGGGGFGLVVSTAAETYLAKVIGGAPKIELESEKIFTIAELKGWFPDHAYCRLA